MIINKQDKLQRIEPNEDFINMIGKIIEQNQVILDTNKEIIRALTTPLYYIPEED